MPTGMSGLFRNTYGARAEREHDMKRLERAIWIFRKLRKIYKDGKDGTPVVTMDTDNIAEFLGWLEELKEYRAMGLDEFRGQGKEHFEARQYAGFDTREEAQVRRWLDMLARNLDMDAEELEEHGNTRHAEEDPRAQGGHRRGRGR